MATPPLVPLLPLSLLMLLLLSSSVSVLALTVTNGDCKGSNGQCENGATVTLTLDTAPSTPITTVTIGGANSGLTCANIVMSGATLTCKLTVADEAKTVLGQQAITLSDGSETIPAGNLVIGNFGTSSGVDGWNNAVASADRFLVAGQSGTWPTSGTNWLIIGNFDTSVTYEVVFYYYDEVGYDFPTCTVTKRTQSTLTCNITSIPGTMGMYRFLVREEGTQVYLPGSASLPSIAVNPPLPKVSGASGQCAENSSYCKTDAELVLQGENFNFHDPKYSTFIIGNTSDIIEMIKCVATTVQANSLTCNLTVADGVPAGEYPVFIVTQVCMMGMKTPPQHIGNLMIGNFYGQSIKGWNDGGFTAPADFPYRVMYFDNDWPSTGDKWHVIGTFAESHTYTVQFYQTEAHSVTTVPICKSVKPMDLDVVSQYPFYSNALECELESKAGTMGMLNMLVYDVTLRQYLPVFTLFYIAVNPPLPTVSSAKVNGDILTFTGTNFNPHDPSYNFFYIVNESQENLFCNATGTATETQVSCKLFVNETAVLGSYPIYVRVQVCFMGMRSPPVQVGNVVVRSSGKVSDWEKNEETTYPFFVENVVPGIVGIGDHLFIAGNFNTAPNAYEVVFVSTAKSNMFDASDSAFRDGESGAPSCAISSPTPTLLTCEVKTTVNMEAGAAWTVYVKDLKSDSMLFSRSLFPITFEPPVPVIDSCEVKGKTLTCEGENFSYSSLDSTVVSITNLAGITCKVTSISESKMACDLEGADKVSGTGLVEVASKNTMGGAGTPVRAGLLFVEKKETTFGNYISQEFDDDIITHIRKNPVAIAFAVIFGVATLGFIIAFIVICCRCKLVPKNSFAAGRGDGATQDRYWNADRVTETQSKYYSDNTETIPSTSAAVVDNTAATSAADKYRLP